MTAVEKYRDSDALARENFEYYEYAKQNGHEAFCMSARRCQDFLAGRQWDSTVKAKLDAQRRPALTINQIKPTVMSIMGEHLANRADVTFKAVKDGSVDVASVLDKLWINISNNNRLDWKESQVFARGVITGRGYYDVRVDFDDQMQGEARIYTPRPQNVILDPEIETPDPRDWPRVMQTKWLSLNDIELLFGREWRDALRAVEPSQTLGADIMYEHVRPDIRYDGSDPANRRSYRFFEAQYRQMRRAEFFVDMVTGDMRRIPQDWDRNKISALLQKVPQLNTLPRLVQDIRMCVSIDRFVMSNDWSNYDRFTIVPYFPFMVDGEPIGLVQDLLGPQELLNKTTSMETHILNTSANSGWIVKAGALVNMTIEELEERGAETGLVMVVNGDTENVVTKIQPNSVPSGHDRLSYKAAEFLKEISGVSDSMRGFDREDVAAKAIMAKQARGAASLAEPFSNLNRSRQLLAESTLAIVQAYYTEPRVLQITGGTASSPQLERIEINQPTAEGKFLNDLTVGEYAVTVTPASPRSTPSETKFEQLASLAEMGLPIPMSALIMASDVPDKLQLIAEIEKLNGGEDPGGDSVAQRQAERQMQEMEMMIAASKARAQDAAAMLSEAKARKVAGEAIQLPEIQKLEEAKAVAEHQATRMEQLLKAHGLRLQAQKQTTDAALAVKKMENDKVVAKEKAKAKPKTTPAKKAKSNGSKG